MSVPVQYGHVEAFGWRRASEHDFDIGAAKASVPWKAWRSRNGSVHAFPGKPRDGGRWWHHYPMLLKFDDGSEELMS